MKMNLLVMFVATTFLVVGCGDGIEDGVNNLGMQNPLTPVSEFDPVQEEPVVEEPVVDEPVVDEPVADEPVADEPVVEEPVVDEPVEEEPVVEEPAQNPDLVNEDCSDPYPGYAAFCLSDYENELNGLLANYGDNLGTAVRPNPPLLPQGELILCDSSTACGLNASSVATEANLGHRRIILSQDINGIVLINRAKDVEIHLNGHHLDGLELAKGAFAAERIHIIGPGTLGAIFSTATQQNPNTKVRDVLVDGVLISIDLASAMVLGQTKMPIRFQAGPLVAPDTPRAVAAERIGIVNSLVVGRRNVTLDSSGNPGTAAAMVSAIDFVYANTNIFAGIPSHNDWGHRMNGGSQRQVFVDSWMEASGNKPVFRMGRISSESVMYTTPSARNTNRQTTLKNIRKGGLDASQSESNIINTNNVFRLFTRAIAGRIGFEAGMFVEADNGLSWGPHPASGYTDRLYLRGGTDFRLVTSPNAFTGISIEERFNRTRFLSDNRTGFETWNFDALVDTPNTFNEIIISEIPNPPVVMGGESLQDREVEPFVVGSGL